MRNAFVSAGASGIGLVIAKRLQTDGFAVHVSDINDSALEEAKSLGFECFHMDASSPSEVKKMAEKLKNELPYLDVLVNNAGIAGPTATVNEIEVEDWERTIKTNLTSMFLHVNELLSLIKSAPGNGRIINLSSAAGRLGMFGRSAYTASKAGVIGFTKTLAIELGPLGITANVICPGAVAGPRIDKVIESKAELLGSSVEEVASNYQNQSAIQELISPESIADIVAFICSASARQINGQVLSVDGYTQKLY